MDNREEYQQTQDRSGLGGRAQEARQKAIEAYDGARQRATDTIGEAPLSALGAGFAGGALIAALLPKTETESELLRPVSTKLRDNARTAVDSAREAGSSRLRELGLTPDAGRDAFRDIVEGVGDAARTSAQAAFGAARGER